MKNEHTSSTAPLLIGMAAGAALGAAGVMATNTSQRQMRRTARKIAKGAEHAVSQLDKMVGDFVEHKMEADGPRIAQKGRDRGFSPAPAFCCSKKASRSGQIRTCRGKALHLACARPFCCSKAPLGLSLLRKRKFFPPQSAVNVSSKRTVWVPSLYL